MNISIITPYYKGKKYLSDLIKMVEENISFLKEKKADIKLDFWLINDSPDENIELPNMEYDYINVVNNDVNSGIHYSRVHGLKVCSGDYVLMLDQDDVIYPDTIWNLAQSSDDGDIIIGNGYIVDGHKKRVIYNSLKAQNAAVKLDFYLTCTSMCVSPGHVLIRKSSISQKWYDNIMTNNGSDDYFLWLLMFDQGAKFKICEKTVYEHINTGENVSSNRKKMYESSMSFCKTLSDKKLVDSRIYKKITRRTDFKMKWNFEKPGIIKKSLLAVRNADILVYNIIYKRLFH